MSVLNNMKSSIRKDIMAIVKAIPNENILYQSAEVANRLFSFSEVQHLQHVCVYLSMGGEIETKKIIQKCFELGKTVYVPKIVGKSAPDMRMFRLQSLEQLESFPKNNWGIPEPPIAAMDVADESYLTNIDLVFLPGVAFDSFCGRIGHGKGYYDCFLSKLFQVRSQQSLTAPTLIGLSLEEQIIEACPMEPHDNYTVLQQMIGYSAWKSILVIRKGC